MMLSALASQGGRELRESHVLPAGGPADALTPAQEQPAGPALVPSMAALLPSAGAVSTPPPPPIPLQEPCPCPPTVFTRPPAVEGADPKHCQASGRVAPRRLQSLIIIIRFSHDELFNGLWPRRKGVSWEWVIYCCYSALFLPSLLSELSLGNYGLMPSYPMCGTRSPHLPTRQLPPSHRSPHSVTVMFYFASTISLGEVNIVPIYR